MPLKIANKIILDFIHDTVDGECTNVLFVNDKSTNSFCLPNVTKF